MTNQSQNINIVQVPINDLKPTEYNPRKWDEVAVEQLTESINRFGLVDPIIANGADNRKNVVIGGHFRLFVAQKMGYTEMPVVYINLPEINKEKELNLRLNKNTGEWDLNLLAEFDESFLADVGFSSEDIDDIFEVEDTPEQFDLQKELDKLNITNIEIKKGDRWLLGDSVLYCGDSTIEDDMQKLMNGEKANMCFTDPPYILDYLKAGKRKGNPTEGFGAKKNRRYLETDVLPDDFTEKWMTNIKNIAKDDFSIIVYENWKNIPTIWDEMAKHWKIKNMLVWHLPNRTQGFAAKHKFFSKHDIAMVGASGDVEYNLEDEEQELQNEYETALYAISGKPQWEGYEKGKKICPSDFIEFNADDAKHSGQGIIFGTKPLQILIPYIKVLTKRGDLIVEPFGGSGSTLIAATKMNRRCYIMEKSPVYAEVIRNRWEKLTGKKAIKYENVQS
ncbi:MAG: ParB domain protein nuclease [Candidatus Magasanikbacteria bacterium GW2011_GWC2_37_14]|uniref:ParB domain protein nuclease n=1 Tax=Candidatus Magasanikbacteria bacterium GW2011_GWC2_37_14 TaxID=1619046 RepID=A0A0G0IS73_9BACT|nr:MAG: ParB domain protein nuclease [Candidatus Magasanikbacteria bacterium GW2011_GWC2_37_14]